MWIQTADSSMLLKQSRNTQHSLFSLLAFPSLLYLCVCGVYVCVHMCMCVCACVCVHTCISVVSEMVHMWRSEDTAEIGDLLLPCGFWEFNPGFQAKLQQLWLLCSLSSPSLATMFPLQLLI